MQILNLDISINAKLNMRVKTYDKKIHQQPYANRFLFSQRLIVYPCLMLFLITVQLSKANNR